MTCALSSFLHSARVAGNRRVQFHFTSMVVLAAVSSGWWASSTLMIYMHTQYMQLYNQVNMLLGEFVAFFSDHSGPQQFCFRAVAKPTCSHIELVSASYLQAQFAQNLTQIMLLAHTKAFWGLIYLLFNFSTPLPYSIISNS